MLVETKSGRWVRTEDIVELYHLKGGHGCRAVMREGPPMEFYRACEDVANAMVPVVAAQPGYEALQLIDDGTGGDGPWWVSRCPIIAWRCHGTHVDPIAIDEDNVMVVKCPDGRVLALALAYENEEAWVKAEQEDRRARLLTVVK